MVWAERGSEDRALAGAGPWAAAEAASRRTPGAFYSLDEQVIFEPASRGGRFRATTVDVLFAVILTLGTQWVLFVLVYGAFEGTAAATPYVYAQNLFALSMLVLYPWLTTARGGGWGKRMFDLMSVDESTGGRPGYGSALVGAMPGARVVLRIVSIFSPIKRRALARLASTRLTVVRRSCSIQQYERGMWRADPRSPIPLERERRAVLAPRSIRDRVLTVGGAGAWIGPAMLLIAAVFAAGWIVYNLIWLAAHWL